MDTLLQFFACSSSDAFLRKTRRRRHTLLKKKGPRGVRIERCYSPGGVLITHKGVQLTYMGVDRAC